MNDVILDDEDDPYGEIIDILDRLDLPYMRTDNGSIEVPCTQHPDEHMSVRFNERHRFRCSSCGHSGSLEQYIRSYTQVVGTEPTTALVVQTPTEVVKREAQPVARPNPADTIIEAHYSEPIPKKHGSWIMFLLAILCIVAGIVASVISGIANYLAFSQLVTDNTWSAIVGVAGVIASVVVFVSYSFAYWHINNRRIWEGIRVIVITLVASTASIIGTNITFGDGDREREASIRSAEEIKLIQNAKIANWQTQLDGIDENTRSVDAISKYLSEVERVGKTNEKPYRMALAELEDAKRRDGLLQSVEDMQNTQMEAALKPPKEPLGIPSLWIAIILELLASQTGAIGIVVLLNLKHE